MRWKLYAIDEREGVLESPSGEQIKVSFTPFTRLPFIHRDWFDKVPGLPPISVNELADDPVDDPVDDRTTGWSDPWPLLPKKSPDDHYSDMCNIKRTIDELNMDTAWEQCKTGIERPFFTHGPREPDRVVKRKK